MKTLTHEPVRPLTLAAVLLALIVAGGGLRPRRLSVPSNAAVVHESPSPGTTTSDTLAKPPTWSPTNSPDGAPDRDTVAADLPAANDPELATLLSWATGRFQQAGLTMPDASVYLHDDRSECRDHIGICIATEPTPEIHLCFRR